MTPLQDLQAKIKSQWDLSQGEISKAVYSILHILTSEVIRIDNKTAAPANDELAKLKAENDHLKAQLTALSQSDDIVEATRNALRQREDADDNEQTASRLPVYAARLMSELDAFRDRD